jgi:hypothetical protein
MRSSLGGRYGALAADLSTKWAAEMQMAVEMSVFPDVSSGREAVIAHMSFHSYAEGEMVKRSGKVADDLGSNHPPSGHTQV